MLADSLAEWAGERGYRWNDRDGEALARSMESWQPFPDTVPALRAAKQAGLRLWIISNTDRAIIEHSLRHLEVEFDGVTVAEDCRAYKPSDAPFQHALREIGARPEEILHVAFGFKYDLAAAQRHRAADGVGEPSPRARPGARASRLRMDGPVAFGRRGQRSALNGSIEGAARQRLNTKATTCVANVLSLGRGTPSMLLFSPERCPRPALVPRSRPRS